MAISLKSFIGTPPRNAAREAAVDEIHAWIAALPVVNPPVAQGALIERLNHLLTGTLDVVTRLAVLDELHRPLAVVHSECSLRYVGKPLPLSPGERHVQKGNQQMRQLFADAYSRCADDAGRDAKTLAVAVQRHLATLAALMADMMLSRVQPERTYWQQLNSRLAFAESHGLLTAPVADPLRHKERLTTPLAAFNEAVLIYAASTHELPARQVNWVIRWARRWATKLEWSERLPDDLSAMPLNIDIASDLPPTYLPAKGGGARFLLTPALRKSIKVRIAALEKGKPPTELQLGDDCTQPACGQLLDRLYQRWCKGGDERRPERKVDDRPGRAVAGLESILHLLLGRPVTELQAAKPALEATKSIPDLRLERERMALFGSVTSLAPDAHKAVVPPPPIENGWRVLSESITGLCMARPLDLAQAARLYTGQLLAVEVPGTNQFLLSSIRWLSISGDQLRVGVELHPSPIQAVVAHLVDRPDTVCPAFLLPQVPASQCGTTIITAPGTFKPGRVLEVHGQAMRRLKLLRLIERGEDYEQAEYR